MELPSSLIGSTVPPPAPPVTPALSTGALGNLGHGYHHSYSARASTAGSCVSLAAANSSPQYARRSNGGNRYLASCRRQSSLDYHVKYDSVTVVGAPGVPSVVVSGRSVAVRRNHSLTADQEGLQSSRKMLRKGHGNAGSLDDGDAAEREKEEEERDRKCSRVSPQFGGSRDTVV